MTRDKPVERSNLFHMRPYELLFIVRPELEPESVTELTEQLKNLVTEAGGEVQRVGQLADDNSGRLVERSDGEWTKRKFAYPVQKKTEGYYVLMHMQASPELLPLLERNLQLNESVMRHIIVRLEE